MQCSVKCIYKVHCTAPQQKQKNTHYTVQCKKILRCYFLHSAVFYVCILQQNAGAFCFEHYLLHILMCTVRKKSVPCTDAQWNENQFSEQKNGRVRKKSTFNFYKNNNNFWFRKLQFIVSWKKKKKLMLLWLAATQNEWKNIKM
jgi:hypothetical protein